MRLAWSTGHDFAHPGAFSRELGDRGIYEHFLAKEVVSAGIGIIRTKYPSWEVFDPSDEIRSVAAKSAGAVLMEKIAIINTRRPEIAIESHFNSSANPSASGCETIYFSLAGTQRFSPIGKKIAQGIQEELLITLNSSDLRDSPDKRVRDRGIKGMGEIFRIYGNHEINPRFAFLTKTKMPALILEPLFLSSPIDMLGFKYDKQGEIYRIAKAIVSALAKWNDSR